MNENKAKNREEQKCRKEKHSAAAEKIAKFQFQSSTKKKVGEKSEEVKWREESFHTGEELDIVNRGS